MTDGQKKVLDQYLHHSRVLDNEGLKKFYADGDFGLLCSNRMALTEMNLDEEKTNAVQAADDRLTSSFDSSTLQKYADQFPTMPIRDWWG